MKREQPSASAPLRQAQGRQASADPLPPAGGSLLSRPPLRRGVAWGVLALCLVATGIGWQVSVSQVRRRVSERFDQQVSGVSQAIQTRLLSHEQLLKGAGGLFAASHAVDHDEWHAYVKSLEIRERYPGIRALGFIADVPEAERERFVASNRLARADFALSIAGPRSRYLVVQYVEPAERNVSLLGHDFSTEPRVLEAAERARQTGQLALTRKLGLLQSPEDVPSVMLLLPVNRSPEGPGNLQSIDGWVYALLFTQTLLDEPESEKNHLVDFEVFDENHASQQTLLYDTDGVLQSLERKTATFERAVSLPAVDRRWTVHIRALRAFDDQPDYAQPRLLLLGGLCISFLLFGITRSLATTRQRALAWAEQMTEKFRLQERAVIASNNGIFITDAAKPGNPILYANPAMERMTGYGAGELLGRDVQGLMGGEVAQPGLRTLQEAMAFGHECRVILCSRRRDATLFWHELSVSPVRDPQGEVNHFVCITEDITERKQAEETLRATSALQRAILDSAGYAVISTSPDGLIRIFNAAAERMTGHKAADVVGQPTSVLINDWTQLEERARQLSEELGRPVSPDFEVLVARARLGQADEHEWSYVRKDGTRVLVLLSVTPVRDERGLILGFMGIASDITERKRAEAELQQAIRSAETANRAKSEFLANMSHEIRTPMNAVIGMTELALGTELTREQRGYLAAARNSAADLLAIINDILDFSKIEAGKLEVLEEPFALRDSLALTLKAFSLRAAEKGLELTLRVHHDVPDALVGDVGRLRQILNNLVGNALKFTHQGEVAVEVALAGSGTRFFSKQARGASPASPPPECLIHITVADTGIGIPMEKQLTIFDAFTQADASVTRRYGGTGLGLAITSKLCRLLGGDIWVESEPDHWSRFHFTAAFKKATETAPSTSSGQALSTGPLAVLANAPILIVDDHAPTRQILAEMLTGWRMRPIEAGHAAEACAALAAASARADPVRFVLLDALIPGTDTTALAAEFTRADPALFVILMQPSVGAAAEAERFRANGVDTFLVKPIGRSELLNALWHCAAPAGEPGEPVHPSILAAGPGRALRVLLAEDNAVNRELATTVLRKMNHSVVTVGNGQQALAAWEAGGFDLILMDVQMPAMDGIEATQLIRERERGTGKRVPIIGLTAHAMMGDREQALAAGMDEYVTKPLQLPELAKAIRRWAPSTGSGQGPSEGSGPGSSAPPIFRPDKLLKSLGGDGAALRRLVTIYLDTTPPLLTKLREALTRKDMPGFVHAAHTLKGSLTQLEAPTACALAGALESRGRAGLEGANLGAGPELVEGAELEAQVAELERQVADLQRVVGHWLKSG